MQSHESVSGMIGVKASLCNGGVEHVGTLEELGLCRWAAHHSDAQTKAGRSNLDPVQAFYHLSTGRQHDSNGNQEWSR
jgi:hypothetical protein